MRIAKVSIKEPDVVETILIGILVIWTLSAMYLLKQAAGFESMTLLTWTSLTTFFAGFSSIVLIVIAIRVYVSKNFLKNADLTVFI